MPTVPKILLVDDVPANLKLLVNAMNRQYDLIVADHGKAALQLAEQERPDLILLDVMMPEMDGYAVCRQLRAQESTRDIPIIFITAMQDAVNEMTGLQLGAVDYIVKPFCVPIVLARVATHIALSSAYKQVQQQYVALQELEALRKDMEAIARHDMKSPIDGIISCSTFLLHNDTLSPDEHNHFLQMIQDAARQLREMVTLSMNLIRMEQGRYTVTLQPVSLLPILHHILKTHQELMSEKQCAPILLINGHPEQEGTEFTVRGEETLCHTLLANLLKNAVEASPVGQPVRITLQQDDGQATIRIHNQGAVPVEIRDCFFDKYVTHGKKGGIGLGTYSARLMTEAQNGQLRMESSEEDGTTVTITLLREDDHVENIDRR